MRSDEKRSDHGYSTLVLVTETFHSAEKFVWQWKFGERNFLAALPAYGKMSMLIVHIVLNHHIPLQIITKIKLSLKSDSHEPCTSNAPKIICYRVVGVTILKLKWCKNAFCCCFSFLTSGCISTYSCFERYALLHSLRGTTFPRATVGIVRFIDSQCTRRL